MTIVFKALASLNADVKAFQVYIYMYILPSFFCVIYSSLSPYNDVLEYIYIYIYIYIIHIYNIYAYI